MRSLVYKEAVKVVVSLRPVAPRFTPTPSPATYIRQREATTHRNRNRKQYHDGHGER